MLTFYYYITTNDGFRKHTTSNSYNKIIYNIFYFKMSSHVCSNISDIKPDCSEEVNKDDINTFFKIPICYNDKVQKLNNIIITDLELVKSIDTEESTIYDNVFKPTNKASKQVIKQIAQYYTTDIDYLKETQQLTKDINSEQLNAIYTKYSFFDFEMNDIVSSWEGIKGETGFCEKYLYVDWDFAKKLNNNPQFLQLMSLYNIASPILSLCLPIFILIVPFIVIKLKGVELSIIQYIEILKTLISNHAIFKIFTQFHQVDTGQKIYLLLSSAFYLFSIYQNILVCIRFYSNMQKIHSSLAKFNTYLAYTLDIMYYYYCKTIKLTKYNKFIIELEQNRRVLLCLHNQLSKITPFTFSFSKITELGHIMHSFYQIYDNSQYNNAILYSFGFNGYFNILSHIGILCSESKLTKTSFIRDGDKKCKPSFKKMYYPKFINNDFSEIIKNDCNLNKNMIITGPNASGKTTTLKSAFINILLSQQIGYGCFDSLKLTPFDKLHCYLNIPDTSGRDSLFQAEARRCKEIIECIGEDTGLTHFCIFDELYSGTNPEEAIISANAFMDYIVKNENVTCILTTHYIKLCKKLLKNKMIKNYHMTTLKTNNFENNLMEYKYTYKLDEGISKVKGGLKILHDMNYPKEILDLTTNTIHKCKKV